MSYILGGVYETRTGILILCFTTAQKLECLNANLALHVQCILCNPDL